MYLLKYNMFFSMFMFEKKKFNLIALLLKTNCWLNAKNTDKFNNESFGKCSQPFL